MDEQYLGAYRGIAAVLLQNLFEVTYVKLAEQAPRLDVLIFDWNRIDQIVRSRMHDAGIEYAHTYKWEQALQAGVLTMDIVRDLTDLRMARNRLVQSTSLDSEDVAYWVMRSKRLLDQLEK